MWQNSLFWTLRASNLAPKIALASSMKKRMSNTELSFTDTQSLWHECKRQPVYKSLTMWFLSDTKTYKVKKLTARVLYTGFILHSSIIFTHSFQAFISVCQVLRLESLTFECVNWLTLDGSGLLIFLGQTEIIASCRCWVPVAGNFNFFV